MLEEGGIGGTGITYGRVVAQAELTIGDKRFDAENAIITINGQRVDVSALQTGMLATVISEQPDDQAITKASKITVQSRMVGTIDTVNKAEASIQLLGQTVKLSDSTAISATADDLLVSGALVDVHGFANADGQITATRIASVSTESSDDIPGGFQLKTRIVRTNEYQNKLFLGSLTRLIH